jgi:hypothetical protein
MKCLIIKFGEQCKSWSALSHNLMSMHIMKFLSYNFGEHENHEFLIIPFGEQCKSWSSCHTIWLAWKHEVLVIQFGEQCKSWSSYRTICWAWKSWSFCHTSWWRVQILKFLSYNLVSSANPEVLIIQLDEQCKSWSSYHTIWWAWKSWSSLHSIWYYNYYIIWWAVEIMKCLIIVCFSLLLFSLSLPKYLPQHPVLKLLPIFKYSSPLTCLQYSSGWYLTPSSVGHCLIGCAALNTTVFWSVGISSVDSYQHFRGACSLHLLNRDCSYEMFLHTYVPTYQPTNQPTTSYKTVVLNLLLLVTLFTYHYLYCLLMYSLSAMAASISMICTQSIQRQLQ